MRVYHKKSNMAAAPRYPSHTFTVMCLSKALSLRGHGGVRGRITESVLLASIREVLESLLIPAA